MDEFVAALEAEALAAGFQLDARRLMGLIGSALGPRPEMTHAIERIRAAGFRTAALTNNWNDERTALVAARAARDSDSSTSSSSRRSKGCANPTPASTHWRSPA